MALFVPLPYNAQVWLTHNAMLQNLRYRNFLYTCTNPGGLHLIYNIVTGTGTRFYDFQQIERFWLFLTAENTQGFF